MYSMKTIFQKLCVASGIVAVVEVDTQIEL